MRGLGRCFAELLRSAAYELGIATTHMSHIPATEEVLAAFERVRARYPRLLGPPRADIEAAVRAHDDYINSDRPYYPAIISALFFFASAPFLASAHYQFAMSFAPAMAGGVPSKAFLESEPHIMLSLWMLFVTIPFYLFGLDKFSRTFLRILPGGQSARVLRSMEIDRMTLRFWLCAGLLLMGWLAVPLLYVTAYGAVSQSVAVRLFMAYLLLPIPVTILAPTLGLIVVLALLSASLSAKPTNSQIDQIPGAIVCKLILLLDSVRQPNPMLPADNSKRRKVAADIRQIAALVRDLRGPWSEAHSVDRFTRFRFEQAAQSILSLRLAAILPDSKSQRSLEVRIVSLANTFLSGNLRDLPTVEFETVKDINSSRHVSLLKTITMLLGLGAFLALPLVGWALVVHLMRPTVDETVRPLLPILYSIWCVVGVLSTAEKLAPDARTMVTDVMKILLSRK